MSTIADWSLVGAGLIGVPSGGYAGGGSAQIPTSVAAGKRTIINVFALKSSELERLMRDVELGREIDEQTLSDLASRRMGVR